jgi:protein arginine kinase
MVNEEDHLRIQCLFSGLQLDEAWQLASQVDDAFEERLNYAFSPDYGYLTSCPTNVGTAMRASVMMHLPALVLTQQTSRIFAAITKLGFAVRGIYGEGTEARGNLFQISNQITLGQSEEDIVSHLKGVTRQIIDQERAAREHLLNENREQIEDRVARSYGIMANARIMSSEEAMKLWSDVRLGVDLKIISGIKVQVMNELLILIRPAYLQIMAGQELNPLERDMKRAALLRERMRPGNF